MLAVMMTKLKGFAAHSGDDEDDDGDDDNGDIDDIDGHSGDDDDDDNDNVWFVSLVLLCVPLISA